MRYVITTPEPRWTGEVAGVAFAHGRGLVDDPAPRVVNYFLRRGYGVEKINAGKEENEVLAEGASAPGGGPDNLQHSPGTSVGSEPSKSESSDDGDAKDAEPKKTTTGRRGSATGKGDEPK